MAGSYIVAGARTPIGKMSGALASFSAAELGSFAIRAALERAGVSPAEVDHVIMGQVLMAGQGQVPSRQAAAKAGIPMNVPAININKVCLSGLNSIYLADQMIQAGDADIVIAGGQENMSASPHVLLGSRDGQRMGDWKMIDSMIVDGLWDVYNQYHMGITAENVAKKYGIDRAMQDALALASQQKAAAAQDAHRLALCVGGFEGAEDEALLEAGGQGGRVGHALAQQAAQLHQGLGQLLTSFEW